MNNFQVCILVFYVLTILSCSNAKLQNEKNHILDTTINKQEKKTSEGTLSTVENDVGFSGTYKHQELVENESHYIIIKHINDTFTGHYYGCEGAGEHGIFYYAVDLSEFLIQIDSVLTFKILSRTLFSEPVQLGISPYEDKDSGISVSELIYEGYIKNNEIHQQ